MKILVGGGAGYIGSICAEVLLNQGHEVAILDNLSEGHRRALSMSFKVKNDLTGDAHRTGHGDPAAARKSGWPCPIS